MDIKHFNVVCDASRHGVHDCLVSVFYSHDNNVGAYPPTQSLRSSKFVSPGEIICDSQVEQLLAEGSRTRLSGYRVLQALSHQIQLLTDSRLTLTSFLTPEKMTFALQPSLSDVTRVVRGVSVTQVEKTTGEASPAVSLLDLAQLPILVIGMDQGSNGCAAAAYLQDAGTAMVHFYWDGYHRLIRDIKMASASCPPEVKLQLNQGQMCGAYLFSINYKPFAKAGFHDDKRALLESFLQTETQDKLGSNIDLSFVKFHCFQVLFNQIQCQMTHYSADYQDSEIFLEYAELIAMDFGITLRTNEDFQVLFEALATRLDSYRIKKSVVKGSRWFSWHNGCADHYEEFFATRLLLSFGHPGEKNPDENTRSLKELRAGGDSLGGLKLALQCCSWKTWYGITMIKLADAPLWSYYSDSVKKIKDPKQGFLQKLELSGDAWMRDKQFSELVGVLLQDQSEFERIRSYANASIQHLGDEGAAEQLQRFVTGLWHYVIQLLSFRARSMSKHSVGPEAYAKALGEDDMDAHEAKNLMLSDWHGLRFMEASATKDPQELSADMRDSVSKPLRLAYQLMEVGRADEAMSVMKPLLYRLPDTKLVEDVHQRLRTEALANPNNRLLPRELQGLVQTSGQLEARKIPHPARLDKTSFLQQWKITKPDYNFKVSLDSGLVKLPKFFARMLAQKSWRTMSEESLSFSSAAWAWMREYVAKDFKSNGIKLKDTKLDFCLSAFLFCLAQLSNRTCGFFLAHHLVQFLSMIDQQI